jgi:hypothetical protein
MLQNHFRPNSHIALVPSRILQNHFWPNSHITLVPPLRWSGYEVGIRLRHSFERKGMSASLQPFAHILYRVATDLAYAVPRNLNHFSTH